MTTTAARYTTSLRDAAAELSLSDAVEFTHPLSWFIAGRNIVYLGIQGMVFMGVLIAAEYCVDGRVGARLRQQLHQALRGSGPGAMRSSVSEAQQGEEADVAAER